MSSLACTSTSTVFILVSTLLPFRYLNLCTLRFADTRGLREESSVQECHVMTEEKKAKPRHVWGVRDQLPTLEAKLAYDKYLKEHSARLRELERIAGYGNTGGGRYK